MLCPHCQTELKIADRQGIEIDYCPKCRGVWLDRGELDKILERSAATAPGGYPQQAAGAYPQSAPGGYAGYQQAPQGRWRHDDDDDDDDDDRRRYGHGGYGQPGYAQRQFPRRRKSWLGDLFDFD